MIKIFILALLTIMNLFVAQSIAATWQYLSKNTAGEYYYDSENVSGTKENIKLLVKINVIGEQRDGSKSRFLQYTVNCDNSTYLLEVIKLYDEPDLTGRERILNSQSQTRQEAKPNTIGQFYIEAACKIGRDPKFTNPKSNNLENQRGEWTEFERGTTLNDTSTTRKIYHSEVQGYNDKRKISTLSNLTKNDGTQTSRVISNLINCTTKEVFYLSDITYDQHWGRGNASPNSARSARYAFRPGYEEQVIACNTSLIKSDLSVSLEWDAKANAKGSKTREQVLTEYKFKWSNGKDFNMLEVGKMMSMCSGYSASLYELQPRMTILRKPGGQPFLAQVESALAIQNSIVFDLYGEKEGQRILNGTHTLTLAMIKGLGGIDSVMAEARDCLGMTKTAQNIINQHGKNIPKPE